MRYIKAILYTILMSILFLTGIVVVEGIVGAEQINKLVKEELAKDNYQLLLSGQFQATNEIILETASNEDVTVTLRGFETMSIVEDEEVYYLEFVVEATSGGLDLFSNVAFEFTNGAYPIKFLKFLNQELYLVVNEANNTKLEVNTFFLNPSTSLDGLTITYEKAGEEVVLSMPLNLTKEDLQFSMHISDYLNANEQNYPVEFTDQIQLLTPVKLNTGPTVIITIIVEVILIGALTIYIYIFRPRRKLGKIKPSKHLEKDIKRVQQSDKS